VTELPRNVILEGDVVDRLRELPPESIDCVVSSPPYYQLRNYGVSGQIGLEGTVVEWVERMRLIMGDVALVLKPSGSAWINLGDSFSRHAKYGAPAKSLLAAPERLLLALLADGWSCRAKAVFGKKNPMPSSVGDRLNTTYEVVYHLVRSRKYFFDLDLIREPHRSVGGRAAGDPIKHVPDWAGPLAGSQDGLRRARAAGQPGHKLGRNPGDLWWLATGGYHGHHAAFPEALVRRPILATCPEAICIACGAPWRRDVTVERLGSVAPTPRDRFVRRYPTSWQTVRKLGPLKPCGCGAPTAPGVVLDCFMGSGTTAVVAQELGRDFVGIELNPDYVQLAEERLRGRQSSDRAA